MLLTMSLDRAVIDLAARHGGIVSRQMLIDVGKTPHWVDHQVKVGGLTVIKPGFYRVLPLDGHLDLLRAVSVALPKVVVSHESAAQLLRFPNLPPLVPTVTVPSHTTHRFPGVTVRRASDIRPDHIVKIEGLRTTSLMRTVFDLAGVRDEQYVDEVIGQLVADRRLDLVKFASFHRSLARRGKPGSFAIGTILERRMRRVDRSVLERRGLALLATDGIPEPVTEYPAPWDDRERIDIAWPPFRAGIEWDSKAWHTREGDFVNDRRRDREAALAGWVILRYTWEDVVADPQRIVREVKALLASRVSAVS